MSERQVYIQPEQVLTRGTAASKGRAGSVATSWLLSVLVEQAPLLCGSCMLVARCSGFMKFYLSPLPALSRRPSTLLATFREVLLPLRRCFSCSPLAKGRAAKESVRPGVAQQLGKCVCECDMHRQAHPAHSDCKFRWWTACFLGLILVTVGY